MMLLIEQIGEGYDDDDDAIINANTYYYRHNHRIIICTLIECYQSIYLSIQLTSIHLSIYFFLTD
jgi:hypothetical protein